MFVKCACSSCSENLEFDDSNVGSTVTCPHCGRETVLFLPRVKPVASPDSAKLTLQPWRTRWASACMKIAPNRLALVTAVLLALLASVEACFLFRLAHKIKTERESAQVALAANERRSYEHFLKWVDYVRSEQRHLGLEALGAELRGMDSEKLRATLTDALYEKTFAGMSNAFKPLPRNGVVIRGHVFQTDPEGPTIECDRPEDDQLLVFAYADRVTLLGSTPTQLGYCILRTKNKSEFGLSSQVNVIGDCLEFLTFTNAFGKVRQVPSYCVRK